jgi:AraC family transcriptional activator of pobA
MKNNIKKIKFKQNAELQIEVVSLQRLTAANQSDLELPHRTDFYHIFLFENCAPTHYVDFEPIVIQPFSLLFIDKDRVHRFDPNLNYEGLVLIFTDAFFCVREEDTKFLRGGLLFNSLTNESALTLTELDFQMFANIFKQIKNELNLPADNATPILLRNLLHNFLLFSEREKRKQGFTDFKKSLDLDYALLFRDLLEQHYRNLKSVNDYAKMLFVAEKRLGQATSKILDKSPKQMIDERVMLEAKRLLSYSSLSIKAICMQLGFEDPAYFFRFFKKNALSTPLEFRKKYGSAIK